MKKMKKIIGFILAAALVTSNASIYAVGSDHLIADTDITIVSSGKIGTLLQEKMKSTVSEEEIMTLVWFNDAANSSTKNAIDKVEVTSSVITSSDTTTLTKNNVATTTVAKEQTAVKSKREAIADSLSDYNNNMANTYFDEEDIVYISKYTPVILANLTSSEIKALATKNEVKIIDFYEESDKLPENDITEVSSGSRAVSEAVNISEFLQVTRTSNVQNSYAYGYTGAGVKIGVLELHLPDIPFYGINIAAQSGDTGVTSYHANYIMEILTSIAPDATYYIAGKDLISQTTDMEKIEWLISQGVNIISCSVVLGNDDVSTYGIMAQWMDHIAFYHDVHFVIASGNDGRNTVISGAMAYNVITVGNLDHNGTPTNYSDDVINAYSSYYYDPSFDDAFKPDICAPGTDLVTNSMSGTPESGTSFAAPQVAGAIALLCEQDPSLLTRQDAMKAILSASVNFSSPHAYVPREYNYYGNSYSQYGAGLLDTLGSCWVVNNDRYIASSISAGTTSKTHTIEVTSSDDRVRISLAYLKYSYFGNSSGHAGANPSLTPLANLDIRIYAPNSTTPLDYSDAPMGNVEIIDFEPTVTGTYTIEIIQTTPSTSTTYYGLAWR